MSCALKGIPPFDLTSYSKSSIALRIAFCTSGSPRQSTFSRELLATLRFAF